MTALRDSPVSAEIVSIDGKQLSPTSLMWQDSVRRTCLVVGGRLDDRMA